MLLNSIRSDTLAVTASSIHRLVHLLTKEERAPLARSMLRVEFPSTHIMTTNLDLSDGVVGVYGNRFMTHITAQSFIQS